MKHFPHLFGAQSSLWLVEEFGFGAKKLTTLDGGKQGGRQPRETACAALLVGPNLRLFIISNFSSSPAAPNLTTTIEAGRHWANTINP